MSEYYHHATQPYPPPCKCRIGIPTNAKEAPACPVHRR
jgi:hypothetical protein